VPTFPTVRVAAVQATPVMLDGDACIELAIERLFHGIGAGDDLGVTETPLGRIGGLICWENFMPLARYALYRHGPQIWVAPTMDDRDIWTALMRTIAFESGAWVIGVTQYQHRSQFPADLPVELPADRPDEFSRGGTVIVEAGSGEVVAGPLYGGEGILIHDCDLRVGLRAKQGFDAVGHYGREDVLLDVLAGRAAPAPNGAVSSDPAPAQG
jgi:nitrilase